MNISSAHELALKLLLSRTQEVVGYGWVCISYKSPLVNTKKSKFRVSPRPSSDEWTPDVSSSSIVWKGDHKSIFIHGAL